MHPMYLSFVMALAMTVFSQPTLADTPPDISQQTTGYLQEQQPLDTYQEAMSYLLGRNGKPKSAEKAAELFQSLADKNWSSAQQMLGRMYSEGKGVEKNKLLAYKWLSIAVRNNANLANDLHPRRMALQKEIPPHSLQQVEKWIAEWQPEI